MYKCFFFSFEINDFLFLRLSSSYWSIWSFEGYVFISVNIILQRERINNNKNNNK